MSDIKELYKDRTWLEHEYARTKSIYNIAAVAGKSPKTIHNWLIRHGIDRLPMTGRKQAIETIRKRVRTRANNGARSSMFGKRHSAATKAAMSEARKGVGNANWKGGKTKRIRELRRTKEYVAWRKAVIELYRGMCAECGTSNSIEVHHMVSIHKDVEKALDVSNGQVLCQKCHKEKRRKPDVWRAKNKD